MVSLIEKLRNGIDADYFSITESQAERIRDLVTGILITHNRPEENTKKLYKAPTRDTNTTLD